MTFKKGYTRNCLEFHNFTNVPRTSPIQGLGACREVIEEDAEGAWWRKENKEAAIEAFKNTLYELESVLQELNSDFYPGGSGMGVETLLPIFELISNVRDYFRFGQPQETDFKLIDEELAELALKALRDSSHEDWFRQTGKVEALVAELELAFSIKVTEAMTSSS